MEVVHLNKDSFEKVVSQNQKSVLIDFWAVWCGPCQMMGPVLEALAAKHPDMIVGKVNVDDFPELAVRYSVDSIPTLFFFRNGKQEKRLLGYMDLETLESKLGI